MSFNFPIEILIKIFQYVDDGRNLALVCRQWKEVSENARVFHRLKFNEENLEDLMTLIHSYRRFRNIKLKINQRHLYYYIDIIRQSAKSLEFLDIELKLDSVPGIFRRIHGNFSPLLREEVEEKVKFARLKVLYVRFFTSSDMEYILESLDLSKMQSLAIDRFGDCELIVRKFVALAPKIRNNIVYRAPRPSRYQIAKRKIQDWYADNKGSFLIFFLVLFAVVEFILVYFLILTYCTEDCNRL